MLITAVAPVFTEKTLGDSQLFVPTSSFFDLLQACTVAHFRASEVDKDALCSGQSAYCPSAESFCFTLFTLVLQHKAVVN